MNIGVFIFARAGSKGLPAKNSKLLLGRPLIEYTFDIALSLGLSDVVQIYLSTDCERLKDIAMARGISVIDRPAHLAADDSPEWLSWRHALAHLKIKGQQIDLFVSLPPTSPLRSKRDVINAIDKMRDGSSDICFGIAKSSKNPYFNVVTVNRDDSVSLVLGSQVFDRRQDAPSVFDITTVVYAAKPQYVEEQMGLFDGKNSVIQIPRKRAVDIDDQFDFDICELLMARK